MRRLLVRTLLVMLAGLFAGCAVRPPVAPPPKVPEVEVEPVGPAVAPLLRAARELASAGDLEPAGAHLERALRIEPRNPLLWQELARIRLVQGLYRQAEGMAARSNSLAAGHSQLRRENWRIIGRARNALGDHQGAKEAFDLAGQQPP